MSGNVSVEQISADFSSPVDQRFSRMGTDLDLLVSVSIEDDGYYLDVVVKEYVYKRPNYHALSKGKVQI